MKVAPFPMNRDCSTERLFALTFFSKVEPLISTVSPILALPRSIASLKVAPSRMNNDCSTERLFALTFFSKVEPLISTMPTNLGVAEVNLAREGGAVHINRPANFRTAEVNRVLEGGALLHEQRTSD